MKKQSVTIFFLCCILPVFAKESNAPPEYLVNQCGRITSKEIYQMPITQETAKLFVSKNPEAASVDFRSNGGPDGKPALVVRFKKKSSPVEIEGPVIKIDSYKQEDGVTSRLVELEVYLRAVNPGTSSLQFRLHQGPGGNKIVPSLTPSGAGHNALFLMERMSNYKPWSIIKRSGKLGSGQSMCRIVLVVHPDHSSTEVPIVSLKLRDTVSINHKISIPAAYSTFLKDSGKAFVKWVHPERIKQASIILRNEEKRIVGEKLVKPGEKNSEIILPVRGFYCVTASAVYQDGSRLDSDALALVAGEPLPEKIRSKSRYGLCNVWLPASLAMDLGSNQNYHLYNFYFWVKRDSGGKIIPTYASNYSRQDPRRPVRHMAGQDMYPAWAMDKRQRGGELRVPYSWDFYEKICYEYFKNMPELPDSICWQNEPDTRFAGTEKEFVECHNRFAEVVKKARPEAKIAVYCSYGIFPDAFDKWIRLGIMKNADLINTHNYVNGIPENDFISRIQGLKAVLRKHGYGHFPIVITEFGWMARGRGSSSSYAVWTELDKARFAARSMILGTTEDIKGFCLFDGKGAGADSNGFSSYRFDAAPLPQAAAFTTLAKELGKVSGHGQWIKIAPGVHCAAFKRNGKSFWALWTENDPVTLTLPEKPESVISMCGTPLPVEQTLTATPSPVYIEFAGPDLSEIPVADVTEMLQNKPVVLKNPVFYAPVIAGRNKQISFSGAKHGEYTVFCKENGKYRLHVFRILKGTTAEYLGYQNNLKEADNVKLSFALNSLYRDIQPVVKAKVVLKNGRTVVNSSLALAKGTNLFHVELPAKNVERIQGYALFEIESPFRWSQKIPFDVTPLAFPYFKGKKIDWKQVPEISIDKWSTPSDMKRYNMQKAPFPVEMQCAADDDGIAFRVTAHDPEHIQEDLWQHLWQQDSLQILMDLDAGDPWITNNIGGNRYQGHRLVNYGFARMRSGLTMNWCYSAYVETVKGGPAQEVKVTIDRDEFHDLKTVYHIHFSWKSLGAWEKPDLSRQVGFALLLNNYDGKKRTILPFFHGPVNIKNASEAGRIRFYEK